jgi:hypothetical protein
MEEGPGISLIARTYEVNNFYLVDIKKSVDNTFHVETVRKLFSGNYKTLVNLFSSYVLFAFEYDSFVVIDIKTSETLVHLKSEKEFL